MRCRVLTLGVVVFALAGSLPALADSFSSLEGYPYVVDRSLGLSYASPDASNQSAPIESKIDQIVYPVLGFPAIVEPGEIIDIVVRVDGGDTLDPQAWHLDLATQFVDRQRGNYPVGDSVAQKYPLRLIESEWLAPYSAYRLTARVLPGTPMDNYSLLVENGAAVRDEQPAAVSVQRGIDGTFRVVQLTDAQFLNPDGDEGFELNSGGYPLRNPLNLDEGALRQAIAEINFLRPAFAVFTGNLIYGEDFYGEIEGVYEILRESRVPIFMVPGNRDGMVVLEEGVLEEDGLNHFRRAFGPTYFSFDYGNQHIICLNTYDGSRDRRNTRVSRLLGRNGPNPGGQLSQQQLTWLAMDAREATAAGKSILVFMHHDPRGPYARNKEIGKRGLRVFGAGANWNFDGKWDSDSTDDLFGEDEGNNTGVAALEIFAENNVAAVFLGHAMEDDFAVFDAGDEILDVKGMSTGVTAQRPLFFVTTTGIGGAPEDYWGYRIIEVTDDYISRVDYADGHYLDSVPVGNFWTETIEGNDGTTGAVGMRVYNASPRSLTGTMRFFVPNSYEGYGAFFKDSGDALPFKDVGTIENGVALYATVRVEGTGDWALFPVEPWNEVREDILVLPDPDNGAPEPEIEVLKDPADPRHVQLRATGTTDPDGDDTVWRYDWDLGEGTIYHGPVIEHHFGVDADYFVTLRVFDDHGAIGVATAKVRARTASYDNDDDDGCGIAPSGSAASLICILALAVLFVGMRKKSCYY